MNTSHWIANAMATPSANTGNPPALDPPWLPARAMSTATTTAMTVLMSALRLFSFTDRFLSLARRVLLHGRCHRSSGHPYVQQRGRRPLSLRSGQGFVWVADPLPLPGAVLF